MSAVGAIEVVVSHLMAPYTIVFDDIPFLCLSHEGI